MADYIFRDKINRPKTVFDADDKQRIFVEDIQQLEQCLLDLKNRADNAFVLLDSYSEFCRNIWYEIGGVGEDRVNAIGQSFLGNGRKLYSCKFHLATIESPVGSCVAKLYAHTGKFGIDGLPTGEPLAVSDPLEASTFSDAFRLETFKFTGENQVVLNDNTPYFICFDYLADVDWVAVGCDSSSPTHPGNSAYQNTVGWYYRGGDLCFYVYVV